MDCAQFDELVHDLDRPGTEAFSRRHAALAHAESCSRCAILVMQSESLDVALRALAKRDAGRQATPLTAATLMEEFQRRKFASLGRKVKRQVAALGAAAAVLLALGFWLHFSHSQTPPTAANEQRDATIASSAAPPPANATSSQPSVASTPNSQSAGPSTTVAIQPASLRAESQSDAEFIRLPYADLGGLDNDTVVRVLVTPATLASFGLPVTGVGSGEAVEADLAVSQDGTPQAVRLVSETSSSQEF